MSSRMRVTAVAVLVVLAGVLAVLLVLRPSALPVLSLLMLAAREAVAAGPEPRRPGMARMRQSLVVGPVQTHAMARGLILLVGAGVMGWAALVELVGLFYLLVLIGGFLLPGITERLTGLGLDSENLPGVIRLRDRFGLFEVSSRPGSRARLRLRTWLGRLEWAVILTTALCMLGEVRPPWAVGVLAACAAVAMVTALVESVTLLRSAASWPHSPVVDAMYEELERYAPSYVLYFSAPKAIALYQVKQWAPHLLSLDRRFMVIVREPVLIDPIAEMLPGVPVVLAQRLTRLESVIPSSVRGVLYVNNGIRNGHMLRHTQLHHIQLMHGDSDKTPSFNKLIRAYDHIYVAGQAAIDRYGNHGVRVAPDAFRIIGRPQTDAVSTTVPDGRPTVLYAPTWEGWSLGRMESSVGVIGVPLVQRLLARGDVRLIVRPHPTTGLADVTLARAAEAMRALVEQAGGDHIWSTADGELSLIDCFNQCTVIIADISSVIGDFLRSEKALVVTDLESQGEDLVRQRYVTATAAYVLQPDAGNLDQVIDQVLGPDPLAAERSAVRRYVLGDFSEPAEAVFHRTLIESLDEPLLQRGDEMELAELAGAE